MVNLKQSFAILRLLSKWPYRNGFIPGGNMYSKRFLLPVVFLTIPCVLFSMPASSTAYGIINHSNENIKLTVIPKYEQERGETPRKRVDYYNRDGKCELILSIIECVKREKDLLLVDDQAMPPYYMSRKNSTIVMSLAPILWLDIQPIEILRYLIDDITIYDMQDNIILTYSDITEDSIDERGGIIITQEMVDAGRAKYRETNTGQNEED
ncbi:MAG: hypothetical protein LBP60_04995 [Spirochaetaceae bacterium]|nr:hypothetical protein [Spirochaetaceae bacterium]